MSHTGRNTGTPRSNPSESLRHFTELELNNNGGSQRRFAQILAANYHDMVRHPHIQGLTDWRALAGVEREKAHTSNHKQLNRYLHGNNIPLELLPAWIETLEEQRLPCIIEVYRIADLVPCVVSSQSQYTSISQIMHQFGDFAEAMAPIMRDSVIDEMDRPHAPGAIQEIDRLLSVLGSLREALMGLEREPERLPVGYAEEIDPDKEKLARKALEKAGVIRSEEADFMSRIRRPKDESDVIGD